MDTHFRDIVSSRYQTARTRIVNKSIPQRMSVILFCMFGSIIINGIVASLNRMLVATGEIIMEERNVTDEKQEQQARISKKPEELAVLHVSFSIAYMVALIPCGVLADKYGGKVFCLGGMIVAAIVCFFLPLIATYFSWILFCSFMMILGVTQAFIRLGEAVLITRWTPISERACFGGFVFGARPVGHGLGHMLSWMAIHYKQYWFLVYLFWGTVGILWSVLYLLSVYEEPKKNPFISIKEKEIIEHEVPPRNLHKMPPWKQIVTCRGVWALIVGQMGHTATMFIIMLPLLSYTWWFHKLDPSYRGYKDMATELDCLILLFTCVGLWLVSVSTGIIIDHAVCNSMLHLRASRIIPTCMGFALPVTFLGIMALVPHNWYLTKICFVLAVLTKGFHFAGFNVNYMDISINFCGTIVSSMLLPGEMVTCAIILWIVKSELLDWHVLVGTLLACSVFLMSHCVFLMIFFRQKWDYSENDELDRRQRLVTFNKYVNSEELLLSYGIILPNTFLIMMMITPTHNVHYTRIYYIIASICIGPYYASFHLIYMDITINYAGCIMSVMIISGEVVTFFTAIWLIIIERGNWIAFFWIMICISIVLMGIFVLLMEEVRAKWDSSTDDRIPTTKKTQVTFSRGSVTYFEPQVQHIEDYNEDDHD